MIIKKSKKLDIPFYKQNNEYYCGPAVLQMVFDYFGYLKSQDLLADHANTNEEIGTTNQNMIKTALDHGFYCYVNNNSTFFEVEHFLEKGLPVIARFIAPELGVDPFTNNFYEHFAIIKGINKKELIFNDPKFGKDFKISKRKFLERWHSAQNKHKEWIMVIAKDDFHLGRQYLPVNFKRDLVINNQDLS